MLTNWQSLLSDNLAWNLVHNGSTLDTITEHVRLLSEHCSFEDTFDNQEIDWPDTSKLCIEILLRPRASWSMHDNLRTFCSIVLNFPKACARFLQLVEPALKESAYYAVELAVPDRLRLMHLLAEYTGAIDEHQWRTYRHRLAALIAAGIREDSCVHRLSRTGSGMTPLMHALLGAMLAFQPFTLKRKHFDCTVASVQNRFIRWPTLLALAGVDLSKYAKREARLFRRHWRTSQRVLWECSLSHCEVIALRFGSTSAEWGLWVSHPGDCYSGIFWDMVEHPERSIPGAWTESEEIDPEPSVRRNIRFHRRYSMCELLNSDRVRWPDDLAFFED